MLNFGLVILVLIGSLSGLNSMSIKRSESNKGEVLGGESGVKYDEYPVSEIFTFPKPFPGFLDFPVILKFPVPSIVFRLF